MKKLSQGSRVGEYILDARIGRGGFGEVWKAHHAELPGKIVAIKIPTDEAYANELRSEAVFQHTLEHPNIARTLGLNTTADPPYFVVEFVPGEDLHSLMKRFGKLPLTFTLAVIKQVLLALAHAHARGVIHRDIKPSNIIISTTKQTEGDEPTAGGLPTEPVVKLTDFGLGQSVAAPSSIRLSDVFPVSEDKTISGTLEYMSPEQRRGEPPAPSADIYSLGIVLFEMLTGYLPQPGDKPSEFVHTLPDWVDRIFEKCFTRPEKRYPSALEMLADIQQRVSFPAPNDDRVIVPETVTETTRGKGVTSDETNETVRKGPMCNDRRCTETCLSELVCPVCMSGTCKQHFTSTDNRFWHEWQEKIGDSTFPRLSLLFCVHCNGILHVGCASRKAECRKCGARTLRIFSTSQDKNLLCSPLIKSATLKAIQRWRRMKMCTECDKPSDFLTCCVCGKGACKEHFFKVFSAGHKNTLFCPTCAGPVHWEACTISSFLRRLSCRRCNTALRKVQENNERDSALAMLKLTQIARETKTRCTSCAPGSHEKMELE